MHSHTSWLQTVSSKPEVILFKFVPITSLLTGVAGSGYLSHAINLYLRCKHRHAHCSCSLLFRLTFLSVSFPVELLAHLLFLEK